MPRGGVADVVTDYAKTSIPLHRFDRSETDFVDLDPQDFMVDPFPSGRMLRALEAVTGESSGIVLGAVESADIKVGDGFTHGSVTYRVDYVGPPAARPRGGDAFAIVAFCTARRGHGGQS